MSRPFHVTTNAAVIPEGGSNAASTACLTLVPFISGGRGSLGSTSPIGHGCVEASGSLLLTPTGLKYTESLPVGSVTQPWSPRYLATRFTPLGSETVTVLFVRSMAG